MDNRLPSPAQIRAALAILRWEYRQLSVVSKVALDTISRICREEHNGTDRILSKLGLALERQGLEFIDGDGVRRISQDIETFVGKERFYDFEQFMYDHLSRFGGDVCVSAQNEKLFREYRKDFEAYKRNMKELVDSERITFRVLATESHFKSDWAQYRWQPAQSSSPTAFYAFGDCLALVSFDHEPAPYVVLIKSGPFADAYRNNFETSWANAKEPPIIEEQ